MNKNKIRSNNKTRQFSYKRHPHTRITHKEYDHETQYRGLKNTQKPIIYTVHILTDDKEKQTHIRKHVGTHLGQTLHRCHQVTYEGSGIEKKVGDK